jgi:nucleoside-diphosphate-sugar epimerase
MAVLLTGATGFVGAWVTRKLLERGHDVVGFDLAPNPGRLGEVAASPRLRLLQGDVSHADDLMAAFGHGDVDCVIHTAAALPPVSETEPRIAVRVNIQGTNNVFEVARQFGVRRVVYASSIVVHGDQPDHGDDAIDEEAPLNPLSVYAYTKQTNEFMARIYARDYAMDIRGLRISTVFGYGRKAGRSAEVSRLVSLPAEGRPVTVRLSRHETSALIYHADTAETLVRLCFAETLSRDVYLSGCHTATLEEAAEMVRRFLPQARIDFDEAGGRLPHVYRIDCRRIERDLGFELPSLESRLRDHINEGRRAMGLAEVG